MRFTLVACITALILTTLCATDVSAKKYPRRKVRGQFNISGGMAGTAILARDRAATVDFVGGIDSHPDVGRWKLKRRKQEVTIDWPLSTSTFVGVVADINTISGTYTSTKYTGGASVPMTLTRIDIDTNVVHHMVIRKTKRVTKGVVFYDFHNRQGRKDDRRKFKIVVYSRPSETEPAVLEHKNLKKHKKLRRLGFWKMRMKKNYEIVEAYVVHRDYLSSLPQETTDYPALVVDGTNVRAMDIRNRGFIWGK